VRNQIGARKNEERNEVVARVGATVEKKKHKELQRRVKVCAWVGKQGRKNGASLGKNRQWYEEQQADYANLAKQLGLVDGAWKVFKKALG